MSELHAFIGLYDKDFEFLTTAKASSSMILHICHYAYQSQINE